MIESGSSVVGVDPASWGLPPGTAFRLDLPAPDLRPFITDYHIQDSDEAVHAGTVTYPLPAWPVIRIILATEAISLQLGPRRYVLPVASLYGTTTRSMAVTSYGGITIGIGISPLGWSRLFSVSADKVRDQVVPLDTMMPAAAVHALVETLRTADLVKDLGPILNDFLRDRLSPPGPHEEVIVGLTHLINDDKTEDIASATRQLGVEANALRRIAIRYFGFPPKVLLVRARFVRSLVRMMLGDCITDYSKIAPTYFDRSHFLRDARRFLGTTPRRYLMRHNAYMFANLRARRDVIRAAKAAT